MKLSKRFSFVAIVFWLPIGAALFAREGVAFYRGEPTSLVQVSFAFWICAGAAWCWETWRSRRAATVVVGQITAWVNDGGVVKFTVQMPDGSERQMHLSVGGKVTITEEVKA